MKHIEGIKQKAYQKLQQIIEKAVEADADSINLEYSDGGLEVCYRFGNFGVGSVFVDRSLEGEVIALIINKAGIESKPCGVMKWTIQGRRYHITVEEYHNFGESAFKLTLGKPKTKRT